MESKDENIKIRRIERWNNRWVRREEYKSKKKEEEPVKKGNHRRTENKDERTNGY